MMHLELVIDLSVLLPPGVNTWPAAQQSALLGSAGSGKPPLAPRQLMPPAVASTPRAETGAWQAVGDGAPRLCVPLSGPGSAQGFLPLTIPAALRRSTAPSALQRQSSGADHSRVFCRTGRSLKQFIRDRDVIIARVRFDCSIILPAVSIIPPIIVHCFSHPLHVLRLPLAAGTSRCVVWTGPGVGFGRRSRQ
jgi:hypothetical protein